MEVLQNAVSKAHAAKTFVRYAKAFLSVHASKDGPLEASHEGDIGNPALTAQRSSLSTDTNVGS